MNENGMIRMAKDGAFMDCYNAKEAIRASERGWTPVTEEVKAPPKKKRARKAKK